MSKGAVRLWAQHSDNEDGFHVYVDGGRFTTLGRNVTTFTIEAACQPRQVYVTAYNRAGESERSNAINIVRDPDLCPPLPPSGLHFVSWADDGQANLRFVDNSDNEEAFFVYVDGVRRRPLLGRNVTAFPLDAGCDPRVVYVTAYNAVDESEPSNSITIQDARDCPKAPSGLHVADLYYGEAYLGFVHDGNNVDGFHVYVNGARFDTLGRSVRTFSIDAECDAKSVYVTAYITGFESGPSNTVSVADPDECPPG